MDRGPCRSPPRWRRRSAGEAAASPPRWRSASESWVAGSSLGLPARGRGKVRSGSAPGGLQGTRRPPWRPCRALPLGVPALGALAQGGWACGVRRGRPAPWPHTHTPDASLGGVNLLLPACACGPSEAWSAGAFLLGAWDRATPALVAPPAFSATQFKSRSAIRTCVACLSALASDARRSFSPGNAQCGGALAGPPVMARGPSGRSALVQKLAQARGLRFRGLAWRLRPRPGPRPISVSAEQGGLCSSVFRGLLATPEGAWEHGLGSVWPCDTCVVARARPARGPELGSLEVGAEGSLLKKSALPARGERDHRLRCNQISVA